MCAPIGQILCVSALMSENTHTHTHTLQMIVFKNSSQGAPGGGLPAGSGPESGAEPGRRNLAVHTPHTQTMTKKCTENPAHSLSLTCRLGVPLPPVLLFVSLPQFSAVFLCPLISKYPTSFPLPPLSSFTPPVSSP